jgi:hypothetical protein
VLAEIAGYVASISPAGDALPAEGPRERYHRAFAWPGGVMPQRESLGVDAAQSRVNALGRPSGPWRARLFDIIFESDTRYGRAFDLVLMLLILSSVLVVMLYSVAPLASRYGTLLHWLEWVFTALFTLEYVLRLSCVRRPFAYASSFFGVVDLLAVLPTYVAAFVPELAVLIDVRVLRLLRIFRVLKLGAYMEEFEFLAEAFTASRKILVFLSAVLTTARSSDKPGGVPDYSSDRPSSCIERMRRAAARTWCSAALFRCHHPRRAWKSPPNLRLLTFS